MIRKSTLGPSGVHVSRLCLGAMMFGGATDEAESLRIIADAKERGVNFIDTADVYAEGRSEEIVGRAIARDRADWVVATKCGLGPGLGVEGGGLSRAHVSKSIDASLKRLNTDYVDVFYAHRHDPGTPPEEVAENFAAVVRSGKARFWALSNFDAWRVAHIVDICRVGKLPPPVAVQPYYSILFREPERDLFPACRHFGLGVVPYSPLARGVLSGKYRPGEAPPEGSRVARGDKRILATEWRERSVEIAAELQRHAEAKGMTTIDFAVAWVLANRSVTSVIAGPRTFAQWETYVAAMEFSLGPDDEAVVDALVPPGHASTFGFTDPNDPVEGRYVG
jgi:aryl-alcohol dehydrogenase-like predicted oxidoreductase